MKKVLFFAVAAALFAACSSKDDIASQAPTAPVGTTGDQAVGFDAYIQRGVTRGGTTGDTGSGTLTVPGFGVFGYYTDANEYDPQALPNFFYNQNVKGTTGNYTYSPVKYWPNEYGSSAISDDADKVTFFAYAPYVDVVPSTGKLVDYSDGKDQWGITGMSRNSATGDPLIKYIATFEENKSVDLCWGVFDETSTTWKTNIGTQDFTKGMPWKDVQHPASITTGQAVKFTFKHALAKLNVQIDHDADISSHADDDAVNVSETKVYVRSISFTGMATKGTLNLNNTEAGAYKPYWLAYNGTADLESGETVTIYDGRKDGKEGTAGAVASNEKLLGLNSSIISDDGNSTEGVTKTLKNLFTGSSASTSVFVIPTEEEVEVEIVYDIETKDANLSTYLSDGATTGSSIENRIRKKIYFGGESKFEAGKAYTIKLHLGMNSVKFDAAVTGWDDQSAVDEWLPANAPMFAAGGNYSVTLPYNVGTYDAFTIFNLKSGAAVSLTQEAPVSAASLSATTVPATNQVSVTSATIAENTTVANVKTGKITVTQDDPAVTTNINFTILAKPFVADESNTFSAAALDITAASGSGTVTDDQWTAATVSVQKKGASDPDFTAMSKVDTPSSASEFKYAGGSSKGTITLYAAPASGDQFKITVKVGDADPYTYKVMVP